MGRYLEPERLWLESELILSAAQAGQPVQVYAYVANNPVTSSDPNGLATCDSSPDCAVKLQEAINNAGGSGSLLGQLQAAQQREESNRQSVMFGGIAQEGPDKDSIQDMVIARIKDGRFQEARDLISSQSEPEGQFAELLERVNSAERVFNTKLSEIPASLQRGSNFPGQFKDYSLGQICDMLRRGDFSTATKKQLQTAAKLIEQQTRLMQK